MNNRMRKENLFKKLGKYCRECGANDKFTTLSFDHIKPRTYELAHLSETQRYIQYAEDARKGLLQVLCVECNSRKNQIAVNKGFRSDFVCRCEKCLRKNYLKSKKKFSNRTAGGSWSNGRGRRTGWIRLFAAPLEDGRAKS